MLFSCLEGLLETVTDLLQFSALVKILPVVTKDIFDSSHVDSESSLNLLGPDDLVRDVWESPDSVEHGRLVELLVLVVQQLVSEHFNVFFDLDQELNLVFLDGSSNSWSGEECIENLEDSEHFIGILGRRKLVLENLSDLGFYFVDLEVVGPFSVFPKFESFFTDIEHVDTIKRVIGLIDLAESNIF